MSVWSICFFCSSERPGKFVVSFLCNKTVLHEFLTPDPNGIIYRGHTFKSVTEFLKWFKVHFNDKSTYQRIAPSSSVSPFGPLRTPNSSTINPQAIQRAAATMSNHVFDSLAKVTPVNGFEPKTNGMSNGISANNYGNHQDKMNGFNSKAPNPMLPPKAVRPNTRWTSYSNGTKYGDNNFPRKQRTPAFETPQSSCMSISPQSRGDQTPLVDETTYSF